MSNQIQITGGAKVRNLNGVLTGTSGVVSSLGINVPDGIPQLDGSGKILVSQLPNSVMEYKGTWDASTNTPTLANGTGNAGDVYLCNVAGTVNFGAGPITFYVGDQVLYSGTIWQRASGATGSVTSVALTESGDALNITGSPITTSGTINIGFNGTSGQYINGQGNLTTFPSLTGYVPYTGATQSVILGEWGLRSGYVSFDTTPTGTPTTEGTMVWNDTDGTVDIKLKGGNVTLQTGQETLARVVNKTDTNLLEANYQVVRIRTAAEGGAQGQRLAVKLAQANTKAGHTGILGLVTENIDNNQEGFITTFGEVREINTTGSLQGETWVDGTTLWLSDTVAGGLTSVEPTTHPVQIGYVVYAHANHGKIFVLLQQGADELSELHDVNITSPSNNQGLFYNSSTSVWENKSIATALGYTPANAARTLTINGTSYDLTADRTWSVGTITGNGTAGNIPYYTGTTTLGNENGFMYDSSTNRFGVNTTVPNATIGANAGLDSGYSLLLKNADANYNGLGFGLDSTYGNLITTQKIGTANARNFTLQNQSGYISLDESGNLGVNILTPKGGVDIYNSTTAALYLHNSASGVAATDGVRLSLNSTNANLRNYESGTLSMTSEGDFSIITAATENFRVNASDGSIYQSKVANALLKSVSGVITAAVAGTDYLTPSSLSGYVPTSRTITINGTAQDLSADRSWSVGTLTGGGAAGRVAFWDGASNVVSDSIFVWDDTNNRLGIGLTNPQRALEIYSASADTHLRLSGAAPSVSMGEAITGAIYQAKFGLATANNQFVTGSVAGDFVINNQTGSTIWAYNSTEKMRLDTSGNLGVGGIARSGYRLHVYDTAPILGIESTTTGNVYLRMLQAGTVVSGAYYNNSDTSFRIFNNNGGLRFDTSSVNGALTIASSGAATFSSNLVAINGNGLTEFKINNNTSEWELYMPNGGTDLRLYRGSDKVTFLANGNVGIGTTSPGQKLTLINGTFQIGGTSTFSDNVEIGRVGGDNNMAFATGGSERMRITSTGNVLIGTTNTLGVLTVQSPSSGAIGLGLIGRASDNYNLITMRNSSNNSTFLEFGGNSSEMYISTVAATPFVFYTNSSERMRITSSGNIITTNSGAQDSLSVSATASAYTSSVIVALTSQAGNSTSWLFYGIANAVSKAYLQTDGNWRIAAGSTYGNISDAKMKTNIVDATSKLEDVLKLKVRNFGTIENPDEKYIGFIAQEFEEIFPKLVFENEDVEHTENGLIKLGTYTKGIKESALVPILVKAIQESHQIIKDLEARIVTLESKIN